MADADVMIVETVVQSAVSCEPTLAGDDAYVQIVILRFHVRYYSYAVLKPEIKQEQIRTNDAVQCVLGGEVCINRLMSSLVVMPRPRRATWDNDSLLIKHIRSNNHFTKQAEIFRQENATFHNISRGDEAALAACDTLDQLKSPLFIRR